MGYLLERGDRADVPLEERSSSELVKLVKKLRWMGLEDEAARVQLVLSEVDCRATLLDGPCDTD